MMDDEMVSVAVAGQAAGVSERTVRRWVSAGHVPAVSAPGGRLVRLGDVTAHAAQVERQRTAAGQVAAGRPLSVEVSGRPAASDRRLSDLAGSDLIAELVATIQQQAEEIGVLRERLRALDASAAPSPAATPQPASAPPAAPVDPEPLPAHPARPVASLRVRVLRWLRS